MSLRVKEDQGRACVDEVLSTVRSAKKQEWISVFVLNVIDGRISSDMSTETAAR
jgi:hypothetical protein